MLIISKCPDNQYEIKYLNEKIKIEEDGFLDEDLIIDFLVKITKMNGDKFLELEKKDLKAQDQNYQEIYKLFENFVNNYNDHFHYRSTKTNK